MCGDCIHVTDDKTELQDLKEHGHLAMNWKEYKKYVAYHYGE